MRETCSMAIKNIFRTELVFVKIVRFVTVNHTKFGNLQHFFGKN